MKHIKVVIRPIAKDFTNHRFPAAYPVNGRIRVWKEDDTIGEFAMDSKLPKLKNITFEAIRRSFALQFVVPENEAEKKTQPEYSRNMDTIYRDFLCNHVNCTINGERHPNSGGNVAFDVIDLAKELRQKSTDFNVKLQAVNMVDKMDSKQREQVLYWFGQSPKAKDEIEILMELADFNTGLVLKRAKNFVETWSEPSADREFIISIQKAIDEKQTKYYIESNFLGITFDAVVDYMRKNEKIYEDHIAKQLNAYAKAEGESNKVAHPGTQTVGEVKKLRTEATELRKAGFIEKSTKEWIMSYEKLLPIVAHGRKMKEEAELV
jgi:hypothetical protein